MTINQPVPTYRILDVSYGEHEGGTKFYELVRVAQVTDAGFGQEFMIRRYAKLSNRARGGGSQIEMATSYDFTKLIRAKTSGGYGMRSGEFAPGSGLNLNAIAIGSVIPATQLARHYIGSSQYEEIVRRLTGAEPVTEIRKAEPVAKPQVNVTRPAGWGTW